jgi:feruloyl esterase
VRKLGSRFGVVVVLALDLVFGQTAMAGQSCASLADLAGPQLRVSRVEDISAGQLPADNPGRAALTGAARVRAALPAHCLVEGMISPRPGLDGAGTGIGFQLRLPQPWNGRFLFQGGGGMDGVVSDAVGAIPISGATALPALDRGYAVVSTDSGHQGKDSSDAAFGTDQQARLDYAYAAIGPVTDTAKAMIAAYYGHAPDHSYYMGCSNGGRTALMAVQRFPDSFDGVVAGDPGFRLSRAAIAQAWDVNALNRAAPRDADGQPILAAALTPADLRVVTEAVLSQCDALDGLADGSVDAPSACHFDPGMLLCKAGQSAACLPQAKLDALRAVFGGAHDSKGHTLYSDWPWDAGLSAPGWRAWKLGTAPNGQANARNATLTPGSLGLYFMTPPVPGLKLADVDFDRAAEQTAQTAAINDPVATLVSSYVAHGGKLIVFQGNSDPVFSANDLAAYWRTLAADNGGAAALAGWARLFTVPGMTHCGGGPALDDFDPLAAIETWVESGRAPDALLARGAAFPGRTRKLCPFPTEPHYDGVGDTQDPASFACQAPAQ